MWPVFRLRGRDSHRLTYDRRGAVPHPADRRPPPPPAGSAAMPRRFRAFRSAAATTGELLLILVPSRPGPTAECRRAAAATRRRERWCLRPWPTDRPAPGPPPFPPVGTPLSGRRAPTAPSPQRLLAARRPPCGLRVRPPGFRRDRGPLRLSAVRVSSSVPGRSRARPPSRRPADRVPVASRAPRSCLASRSTVQGWNVSGADVARLAARPWGDAHGLGDEQRLRRRCDNDQRGCPARGAGWLPPPRY